MNAGPVDITCSMPDCDLPHRARGLCQKHWRYERYHGRLDAHPRVERRRLTPDTLHEYVEVGHADCWLWQLAKNSRGYAITGYNSVGLIAHRVVYEMLVGPVPDGLTLDHLCRVRHCVNPDHLEPVTHVENMRRSPLLRRQTHCKYGHLMAGENLHEFRDGSRSCRTCTVRRSSEAYQRRRAGTDLPNTAA